MGRWFERLTVSILDNSVLYGIVLSSIVLTVSLGIFFLQINFNANQFYGTHDPETAYLEEYLNEWGADDLMILVVDGGESSLLTRARLDLLGEVREAVEAHPLVGATRSLVDHRRPQLSFFEFFNSNVSSFFRKFHLSIRHFKLLLIAKVYSSAS